MKLVIILCLITFALSQSPQLEACIEEKCPDQYAACKAKSGCEDKLNKCVDKCGQVVDYACWSGCIGIFNIGSAQAKVCFCAAEVHCLASVSKLDRFVLSLMKQINLKSE